MLCPFSISQCVRCPPNGNFIEPILCFSTVEEPPWLTERLAKGTVGQWFISSLLTFEHKLKPTPEWPTTKSKSTKKVTRFNHSSISFGPYGYRFCFVSQGTKFCKTLLSCCVSWNYSKLFGLSFLEWSAHRAKEMGHHKYYQQLHSMRRFKALSI